MAEAKRGDVGRDEHVHTVEDRTVSLRLGLLR
jgi:hypothetical protein